MATFLGLQAQGRTNIVQGHEQAPATGSIIGTSIRRGKQQDSGGAALGATELAAAARTGGAGGELSRRDGEKYFKRWSPIGAEGKSECRPQGRSGSENYER